MSESAVRLSSRRRASIGITNYPITNGNSSMTASVIMLYAVSMILCSAVLPISDAFADDRSTKLTEHSVALEIFHLSQYTISIAALIYFMCIIKYYTRKKQELLGMEQKKPKRCHNLCCCKKRRTDDDFELRDKDEMDSSDCGQRSPSGSQNSNDAPDSVNFHVKEQQVHFVNIKPEPNDPNQEIEKNSLCSSLGPNTALVGEISQMSEGINLYLRLGAVGFGFGVMVHDGFKISDQWQHFRGECSRSILWTPEVVLHFLYVFIQTYFLLKYHRIVFNCQKVAVRFCLTHLAVTNVGQWLKVVVFEITEDLRLSTYLKHNQTKHEPHFGSNNETHATDYHNPCHGGFSTRLSPYLYPCAIEYSLIAGAIFFKIFQKVGHMFREGRKYRTSRSHEPEGPLSGCHRSHKGLFIGLLALMGTLVSIALFFVFSTNFKKIDHANFIYQATEITLLFSTTIASILALIQFQKLDFAELSEGGAFDDNLLLVGFAGVMGYSLFLLLPSIETFSTQGLPALLFLIKSATEILQALAQVLFIIEASRRRATTVDQFLKKPGRSLVTFLIVINLAMWIVNTFEVKRAENHPIHINYYSQLPWNIISRIFLPLIIFFRFHSTVCLSDIWAGAYKYYKA